MRLIAVGIVLAAGACASEKTGNVTPASTAQAPYLALGDSIAFGFNPTIDYTQANVDAGKFIGYPELTAGDASLSLTSAACPGETSGSFIDPTQPDHGCHIHIAPEPSSPYDKALKVHYPGSQLDFALAHLQAHPTTELVTIDIGGNDLLVVQDACKGDAVCEVVQLPGAIVKLTANLTTIFSTLRFAGYHGKIVALTQYATNYGDLVQLAALLALKSATESVAALFGVSIAHGYEAMQLAAGLEGQTDLCKTDLLLRDAAGGCNNHPSPRGAQVLTDAILLAL
jgi:hypothetical protein